MIREEHEDPQLLIDAPGILFTKNFVATGRQNDITAHLSRVHSPFLTLTPTTSNNPIAVPQKTCAVQVHTGNG